MITKTVMTPDDASMSEAGRIIRSGGLVAFPTETVYGLGASALDSEAAAKVYAAKGRPSDNPLIVHLSSPSEAEKYVYTTELYYRIAEVFMPGPITVIMKKKDIIPSGVTGGLETAAIRVPSNKTAHCFLSACGIPVAAPSANISGRPSPTRVEHVVEDMDGRIDMIINGGECEIGLESTIVSIVDGEISLLRPGGITLEMLSAAFPDRTITDLSRKKYADGETPPAPGMKYRHYAPRAQVIILTGESGRVASAMAELASRPGTGIICFDEYLPLITCKAVFSLGAENDGGTQAHRLFACLREFDEHPDINTIYAPMPSDSGIGGAICNRLIKASGFTVQSADDAAAESPEKR